MLQLKAVLWYGRQVNWSIRRLERMRVIALARWTLLPSPRRPRYLLFETNWSGADQNYIADFAMLMRVQWRSIWGNTKRFPGPVPVTSLLEHIETVDWGTDHYWSDYDPEASTQIVRGALDLTRELQRFIERTRGQPPDQFAESWATFTTKIQRQL